MKEKKTLLFISPVMPSFSASKGIAMRAGKHIASMPENIDIHLLVLRRFPDEIIEEPDDYIKQKCRDIKIVELSGRQKFKGKNLGLIDFFSENDFIALEKIIKNLSEDIIFFYRIATGVVLLNKRIEQAVQGKNIIVDYDDIESISMMRSLKYSYKILGKVSSFNLLLSALKIRSIEKKISRHADVVLVCSNLDKHKLEKRMLKASVYVVPNVVEVEKYFQELSTEKIKNILFVGTLSYGPNEDALIYFCHEILPLIKEKYNEPFNVYVVGYNPGDGIKSLADIENVIVTGGVDSVVPYYKKTHLVIVPIRYGGGTRIKILEAMALGRPVVSTSIGAEGIDVKDGKNILIGDNDQEFANKCLDLLTDNDLCKNIVQNGRKLITNSYSIENTKKIFINFLG